MPEERTENNPENKPGAAGEDKELNPFSLSRTVRIYLWGALAGGLWIYGAALLNSHPKPLLMAWSFIFTGFCFTGDVLRLWLINHRTKHRMPRWLPKTSCFAVVLLAFAGCLFAVLQEKGPSANKPHLKLIAVSSNTLFTTAGGVEFTNKGVLFSNGDAFVKALNKSNVCCCLMVPFESPFTNASLRLRLVNDSPAVVESIRAIVSFDSDVKCFPATGPPWHSVWEQWQQPEMPMAQSLSISGSMVLLPNEMAACPDLNFPQSDSLKNRALSVIIRITAKDIPSFYVFFQMAFFPSTNSTSPRLIWPTDARHFKDYDVFRLPLDKL